MRIITTIAAVSLAAAGARAQTPEAIMERAASSYASMKTMRAEFRQTITNPLTGTTSVSTGVLLRRQPNLLSINFTNPRGDRVVADGRNVWVYLPSTSPGQVVRLTSSNRNAETVDPGAMFLTSPRSRYNIRGAGAEVVGGVSTNVVILTPKSSSSPFTKAKVWVDSKGGVKQFQLTDINGLDRTVVITKVIANPTISASEFRFTPPPKTRVLDSAALGM
jgi:chaperone LolA